MFVYGQLKNAQLENSVGIPASGGNPVGRFYIDLTNPANAIPMYYNGSAWVPFSTVAALMTNNNSNTATFNASGQNETIYSLSGTVLASLTLNLPTVTAIGQIVRYSTESGVTSVTVTGTVSSGAALTTMAANTVAVYQALNTTGSFIRLG